MRKLTILVDMDDTVENLCDAWVKYLDEKYGLCVKTEDILEWDMTKAFPEVPPDNVYGALLDEKLWKEVKPRKDAQKYLEKLISDGHRVFIVTASHHHTIRYKLDHVLFKYFPYFSMKDVIVTWQKQLINGDVLIDDGPHNLEGGKYKKILVSAPHNLKYDAQAHDMVRYSRWSDIYKYICKLAEEEM